MGLFSSKKATPPKVEIPADILAAVSVNGEKKLRPAVSFPPTPDPSAPAMSTSPFLKTKNEASVQPSAPSSAPAPSPLAGVVADTPKPFQFSDQNPLPDEAVHFTDTPVTPPAQPVAPQPSVERPDFTQITQDKALEETKKHLAPFAVRAEPLPSTKKSLLSSGTIISLAVFLLILILISGGSWYYLNTRSIQEDATKEASIGALEQSLTPPPSAQPKGSILVDQPNYLSLDIETVTLPQIKTLIDAEAQKMISEGITVPVEYLVVDTNNNPVAFSRFAFLVGADTPKDLTEASLEPFSLYIFLDQGKPRIALAVTLKAETPASFPANKSVLPESMKKFLYPEEYAGINIKSLSFAQTSYKGSAISYINIDIPKNFAFDMTSQEGILTFANSKNTLRAVIDKRSVTFGQE